MKKEIKRFRYNGNIAMFLMSFIFVFLFFIPSFCYSKDEIYIAQSSVGGDTGADCSNAHSVAWFNSSNNWDVDVSDDGKIGPGDTVHLCGNITTGLFVYESGTAGNVITILFEPGATMSKAVWDQYGAIRIFNKSYITIDGGATGTIGGPDGNAAYVNGIIENTDNGTELANQVNNSTGIKGTEGKHFTIKNLAIYNIYVRTRGAEVNGYYTASITNTNDNGNGINDFKVTNCLIHDAYVGVSADYGSGDNTYEISYVTAYNCNWGGRIGDRNAASTLTNVLIHHNKFYDWTNWDVIGTNNFHHNGFYGWAESGGSLSNVYVYANEIGPNYGGQYSTSGVFFSGNVSNVYIYNNLFTANADDGPANGMITVGQNNGYSGIQIYNNTFIGNGAATAISAGSGNGTYTIKNNLASGVATFILFNYSALSTLVSDYNLGYNLKVGQEYSKSTTSSSNFKTFPQWQALGYGLHSLDVNPLLNEDYSLRALSPAIDAGTTIALFGDDKNGISRPNAAWDIGAYELLAPPRDLRILK